MKISVESVHKIIQVSSNDTHPFFPFLFRHLFVPMARQAPYFPVMAERDFRLFYEWEMPLKGSRF